ncbi:cell wall hydrolase [Candidatus Kuenenbacteria bacterium]|nr:cell wall hydrolase [Candidatus Kuenenbacteria bacterium]
MPVLYKINLDFGSPTIRNRVEDSGWGDNYYKVITKEKQYSAFNIGDPNRPFIEDPFCDENLTDRKSWKKCYEIAGQIIRGEVEDPTDGANHYYDESIDTPYWANEKTFKIKINTLFFHRL